MKKLLALVLVVCMVLALGAFTASADEGDLVGISMPTKSLERWNRDGSYPAHGADGQGLRQAASRKPRCAQCTAPRILILK